MKPVLQPAMSKGACDRRTLVAALLCLLLVPIGLPQIGAAAAQNGAPQSKPAAKSGPPAAKASSLDDALLEDLDNELLDGVKDLPAKKNQADGDDKPSGGLHDSDDADTEGPGAESPAARGPMSDDEEPLIRIGQQMRTVEKRIEHGRVGRKNPAVAGPDSQ